MATHELWLLRHAKSAWDTEARGDFDRPLNDRGKRDATRMGWWLKEEGLIPDLIIASPARRARQTVKRVRRELGCDPGVAWEQSIYEAGVPDLLAVLRARPETVRRVLLVGHNPGMAALLAWLCGPVTPRGKPLPTAALARLALPCSWRDLGPGKGCLLAITRPRELPADL